MKSHKYGIFFTFLILLSVFFGVYFAFAQYNITADIPSICGNGVKDSGEECDNTDLGGETCGSKGYSGGTLVCGISCTFDVSSCISGGGGGGGGGSGGGGYANIVSSASVVFSGKAYPKSFITLLKDAQIAATVIAGSDANFNINLSSLSSGNYIFSLYGEDYKGKRSSLLTFPVSVSSNLITNINNIFIPPTIGIDKSEVRRGGNITIFGQSVPDAEIIISIISREEIFKKIKADKNGAYAYDLNTALFPYGSYIIKAKASIDRQESGFSGLIDFVIGIKDIKKNELKCLIADINCDDRVDLIDFSIAAYWYKKTSPLATVDLNGDNIVDLIDFSIIAHYWTG